MDAFETAAGAEEPVQRLERWQEFGALWRIAAQTGGTVTISLCSCDGGEEIDRLTSSDPHLLQWLAGRSSSEEPDVQG